MKQLCLLLLCIAGCARAAAQGLVFYPGGDSLRTVSLEAYADVYFGYDFNDPEDGNRPYFVSHARHGEVNVNLAYLSLRYNSPRVRANFTPGFGTYINANYAAERATLRNIVEASIGLRPIRRGGLWIDAGVFGSPYTTENAVARDQLLYTRSIGAEYSPYYLTGLRGSFPVSKTVRGLLYLLNGWQVIENSKASPSYGASLEWRPGERFLLNGSLYVGSERSAGQPQHRGRYFADLYAVWTPHSRFVLSADVYAGRQRLSDSINRKYPLTWYQGQVNGRWQFLKTQYLSVRAEYFRDAHAVLVVPVTGGERFDCAAVSLGYRLDVADNVSFHAEGRSFRSANPIFYGEASATSRNDFLLITGLTARF